MTSQENQDVLAIQKIFANNPLCSIFGLTDVDITSVILRWLQPHRHYHALHYHLMKLLNSINRDVEAIVDDMAIPCLELIALFHDSVYDPRSKRNEELSAELFALMCKKGKDHPAYKIIFDAILDTSVVLNPAASSEISKEFLHLDADGLFYDPVGKVMNQDTLLIFKEFQMYGVREFIQGRLNFLAAINLRKDICREEKAQIESLMVELDRWKPRIGLYAGSFLPFHIGHMNVIEKAEQMFDKVVVGQCINPAKSDAARYDIFSDLPFHYVVEHHSVLINLYRELAQDADVTLVRGLRNISDLQQELNLLRTLQDVEPGIKIVHIISDVQYNHISSTMIRELLHFSQSIEMYKVKKYKYNTGDHLCGPIKHC